MAKQKKPLGQISDEALDLQTGLQHQVAAAFENYKSLNKEAGIYNRTLLDAQGYATKLNNVIEQNKDFIAKIGTQIIRQTNYENQILKVKRLISLIDSERRTIEENLTAENEAQFVLLKKQEAEQAKINEELSRQKAIDSNYHKIQIEAIKKINAEKKAGNYNKADSKANKEWNKAFKERNKLVEKLNSLETKSKEIGEKIAKTNKLEKNNTASLYEEQLDIGKTSLKNLMEQEAVIAESNKQLKKGNFLKELGYKLGLSNVADFARHKETFGLGGAVTLGVIGLIAVALKGVVDLIFKSDKQVTSLAKQLGISKDNASLLRDQFVIASKQSNLLNASLDPAYASVENMVNAMTDLNDQFGTGIRFTNKQIQDQIELTKQMGLTAEEAGSLQKFALLNNKTTEQTADMISDQTVAFRKQTGLMLDGRKILQEVSRIEGALAVQYKNNPELLAKAVLQVKKYGLTLEEAKQSASSLLDFESSISNELEAELLTGKQFNLEKARSLALAGDAAGATAEMVKQIGTLAQFQKLNVIAREGEAKMIGLSVDELSNALVKQQLLKSLSSQQTDDYNKRLQLAKEQNREESFLSETKNAQNGAQLNAAYAQLDAQAKFEAAINRIKEAIGNIFTADFLSTLQSLVTAFSKHIPDIIRIMDHPLTGWFRSNEEDANLHDGMVNPKGRVVISTPQGGIVPDRADSIITTTNPQGLMSEGQSGNNDALNMKLDRLIELLSKGGNVYLDSRKVGTTQGLAYNSWG